MAESPAVAAARPLRQQVSADEWVMRGALLAVGAYLFVTVALPLYSLLTKSFQGRDGHFIGLANYVELARTPRVWAANRQVKAQAGETNAWAS